MLHIQCVAPKVGFSLTDNGNVLLSAIDDRYGHIVSMEFDSESWKRFLEQAPRLKGAGIHVPPSPILVPDNPGA